jgi:catechol 2,3-dioxygenase-like lactoylglutathione lyase family enzyme
VNEQIEKLISEYDRGTISRRKLLTGLALLTAASTGAPDVAAEEQTNEPAFQGQSLNHVTLSVSNVERSRQFYSSIFGVSIISKQPNGINLGLGDSFLGLYAINEPPRVNHFCVGLDEFHVRVAAERLKQYGISPRVRKDKREVYFQDPDGITVQLESKGYRG